MRIPKRISLEDAKLSGFVKLNDPKIKLYGLPDDELMHLYVLVGKRGLYHIGALSKVGYYTKNTEEGLVMFLKNQKEKRQNR